MVNRLPYETKGGAVSEGETFAQLIEYLRMAEEAAYTLGHIANANDHRTMGASWLKVGQRLALAREQIIAIGSHRAMRQ